MPMETPSRKLLPLSLSPVAAASAGSHAGHSTCREAAVPSGLRWQTASRGSELAGLQRGQRVTIDYSKLRELCRHTVHVHEADDDCKDATSREENHRKFMSSYRLLLQRLPSGRPTTASPSPGQNSTRIRHTCSFPVDQSHNVSNYTSAIHGRTTRAQAVINMHSRLRAMLQLAEKLPLQRDDSEVKQLSHHLSHFPSLLPDPASVTPTMLVGMAARCLLETIPRSRFSLPDKGGVYLILQGSVERKSRDDATGSITSSLLYAGGHFGKMEEHFVTKSSYPMYVTREVCSLLRITLFDYERVLQNCEAAERREKQAVVSSCRLLHSVSPAILSTLASNVHWETIPSNTTLLCEGDTIRKVGFIQSGRCQATATVPQTRTAATVVIGELRPGACVGEGMLRGSEQQPYQVTTTTRVRIGWVSASIIRMNEVKKHILLDSNLSIPVPSKDQLRGKYASDLVGQHWSKIKNDILNEIRSEYGIRLGLGKWKH